MASSNDDPLSRRRPSDYPFHLSYRTRWYDLIPRLTLSITPTDS